MYRNLSKIGTVPARLSASRRKSEFSQIINGLATCCNVEVEPPLTLAVCCLDEVAAPVRQERLGSGGAGGRGQAAGGGDRLNAGASGRSPGSETAGRRSRSAGDGNAG